MSVVRRLVALSHRPSPLADQRKCDLKHPRGDEIYRSGTLSMFEVENPRRLNYDISISTAENLGRLNYDINISTARQC
nr:putative MYST-like histone acetyltransferase 1 [Ipomoea batatas]